jgi:hypothetical protein
MQAARGQGTSHLKTGITSLGFHSITPEHPRSTGFSLNSHQLHKEKCTNVSPFTYFYNSMNSISVSIPEHYISHIAFIRVKQFYDVKGNSRSKVNV